MKRKENAESTKQEVVTPPGYVETPVVDPRNPVSTSRFARIAYAKLDKYRERGPLYKYYEGLYAVPETLVDPEFIHEYIDGDDWSGFCYACRVSSTRNNDGAERPYEDGFTFLVFMTEDLKVVEWGFEPCERWDKPGMPADLRQGSMGKLLWSK